MIILTLVVWLRQYLPGLSTMKFLFSLTLPYSLEVTKSNPLSGMRVRVKSGNSCFIFKIRKTVSIQPVIFIIISFI